MIWDVAAGVVIGGSVFALIYFGAGAQMEALNYNDKNFGFGWLMVAAGIVLGIWIVFFKAHFQ
jgi:hypothetical protein